MATKTVKWSTSQPLQCGDCLPANVVLCVKSELVDQSAFVDLDIIKKTINAQVTEGSKTSGACPTYKYTFEYDDSQLADLETPLGCSDVLGAFCKGCLVSWVQEQVALGAGIPAPLYQTTIVNAYAVAGEATEFPVTVAVSITNPSTVLPMRVIGSTQFWGRFELIADATSRDITREILVDSVSVSGPVLVGFIPSATDSAMNSHFTWGEDLGPLTNTDDDSTLLDPGESKVYEFTFDGTMVAGDTIVAINAQLTLIGINYTVL